MEVEIIIPNTLRSYCGSHKDFVGKVLKVVRRATPEETKEFFICLPSRTKSTIYKVDVKDIDIPYVMSQLSYILSITRMEIFSVNGKKQKPAYLKSWKGDENGN